ncbi:TPA: TOPRIM nucleotidyl transferase/hydrolase domain-containing protein [Aeromonas veronii]
MATTIDDITYDEMLSELHHEAVMRNEALKQCIYIFVEGESEEATFKTLLENVMCGLDFQSNGIVIANYNGIGNLKHAIRILRKTLSHDRPIIVTYDDDLEGKKVERYIDGPLIYPFRIPHEPVVTYADGSQGGSFEEAFSKQTFIDACFQTGVIEPSSPGTATEFRVEFDDSKPWFPQIVRYVVSKGGHAGSINKVRLAKTMASICESIPDTFLELARKTVELRKNNPILHPDDVDL